MKFGAPYCRPNESNATALEIMAARVNETVEKILDSSSGILDLAPQRVHQMSDGDLMTICWVAVVGVLFWLLLFYVFYRHCPKWLSFLPPSTKEHENEPEWCAQMALNTVMVSFVAIVASLCTLSLLGNPGDAAARFGAPDEPVDYLTCLGGSPSPHDPAYRWIGRAGWVFMTFMIADLLIQSYYGMMTIDSFIHHVTFLVTGVIIRRHCVLRFTAGILMTMEISTPFLNLALLLRHRGDNYTSLRGACQVGFLLTFLFARICLNPWGIILVVKYQDYWRLPSMLPGEDYFLLASVIGGAAIQFYWLPAILNSARRVVFPDPDDQDDADGSALAKLGEASPFHNYLVFLIYAVGVVNLLRPRQLTNGPLLSNSPNRVT